MGGGEAVQKGVSTLGPHARRRVCSRRGGQTPVPLRPVRIQKCQTQLLLYCQHVVGTSVSQPVTTP